MCSDLWQWCQKTNFSSTKNNNIPNKIKINNSFSTPSSSNSGSKCKNAPPSNAPTDNETKKSKDLSKVFLFIEMVTTPIKETNDMINIEINNSININSPKNIYPLYFKKPMVSAPPNAVISWNELKTGTNASGIMLKLNKIKIVVESIRVLAIIALIDELK